MSKDVIEAFLEEMRKRHGREIEVMNLPDGTREYLLERMQRGDVETITFMLKLSYLMGVQAGYAAHELEENGLPRVPNGPLQA